MSLIETKISKAVKAFSSVPAESVTTEALAAANAVLTEEGITGVELAVAGSTKAMTDAVAAVATLKADLKAASDNYASLEEKYNTLKPKEEKGAETTVIRTDTDAAHENPGDKEVVTSVANEKAKKRDALSEKRAGLTGMQSILNEE